MCAPSRREQQELDEGDDGQKAETTRSTNEFRQLRLSKEAVSEITNPKQFGDDHPKETTLSNKSNLSVREEGKLEEYDDIYTRPGFRVEMRPAVWEKAVKSSSDGRVRDPLTNKTINRDDEWDMGHKPGYEFRKHQESARERGISREQFLDEFNNPEHFRPELPLSNRSHKLELLDDIYFGD